MPQLYYMAAARNEQRTVRSGAADAYERVERMDAKFARTLDSKRRACTLPATEKKG